MNDTEKDEAMVHKPYHAWMQELLDGALAGPARRQLEEHLAGCVACQANWATLSAVDRLFKAAPVAAPRAGFSGRFNARLARRRSRPRLVWGAVALGTGAVAASAVVVPLGLALIWSLLRVARQPATLLALNASAAATLSFVNTVIDALLIAGRALLEASLDQPLAWAATAAALALTAAWLVLVRKLVPQGSAR
jgi:anti-sigma factor RsiW